MKNIVRTICLSIIALLVFGNLANTQSDKEVRVLKLMTYNLKFASPTFEPSWEVRREMQIDLIRNMTLMLLVHRKG